MDLKQLIATTKGDRSFEDLARAAGGTPGAARWQQLATKPQKAFPDAASIRGISRALAVTEMTVVRAAAETIGIHVPIQESRLSALLPADAARLTDRQVAALRQVLLAMLEPALDIATPRSDTDAPAIAPEDPEVEAIHEEVRGELAEERHLRSAPKGPSRNVRPRA